MKFAKKGNYGIQDLGVMAMSIVGAVIIVAFGAQVLADFDAQLADNTTADDTVKNGSKALGIFGKWTPTVALIGVIAVILGLISVALYVGLTKQ